MIISLELFCAMSYESLSTESVNLYGKSESVLPSELSIQSNLVSLL